MNLKHVNSTVTVFSLAVILVAGRAIQLPAIFMLCAVALLLYASAMVWWHLDIKEHADVLGPDRTYYYRSQANFDPGWIGLFVRYLRARRRDFRE